MKAKENVKNDDINLKGDTLIDLQLADEQAEEVSGGRAGGYGNDVLVGGYGNDIVR